VPYFFQRTGYDAAEIDTPVWYPDREAGTAVGEVIAGTRDWTGSVSPPVICRDVVVVGSSGMDWRLGRDQPALVPPGDVRGFDVRTGAWQKHGAANVWSMMTADDDLGYFYLPFSTPDNDFYGGRPGDNLFGESLVCLNAATGERVWHYQLVHHRLWDYDIPAAPILLDLVVDGQPIQAVAQVTKQAFCLSPTGLQANRSGRSSSDASRRIRSAGRYSRGSHQFYARAAQVLIASGADVNAQTDEGNTLLALAVTGTELRRDGDKTELLLMLIEAGGAPTIPDERRLSLLSSIRVSGRSSRPLQRWDSNSTCVGLLALETWPVCEVSSTRICNWSRVRCISPTASYPTRWQPLSMR
jgi:hypothetical protein